LFAARRFAVPLLAPAESRTVLENVRWETFLELAEGRSSSVPRMTFDRGVLELMTPRRQHEQLGCLIGRIVETYSEVRGIEILSCASTTFKRVDLDRAFEPDESYFIAHADQIRPKDEVDLLVDPPPDLVIEVEITSSAIAKLKLFAAMGIPEVWRHDGTRLTMLVLADAAYEPIEASIGLPGLTPAVIDAFVARRFDQGETALIKEFRAAIAAG
jgi:Uma2 family endonuclease